jgi:beta-phosphoglucomutase family hydrolase
MSTLKNVAFLFDMDGTLVNNMAYHTRAWVQVLREEFGLAVDPKDWERRTAGKTTPIIMREEVDPAMSDARVEEINERKEHLYRQMFRPNLALATGAEAFLRRAKSMGIPLAVCTSANKINLDFVLDGCGIRDLFAATLCREDISNGKPDPEIFIKGAAALGIAPNRCMVFEDAPAGIEAARRAGMKAVAITAMLGADELLPLAPVMKAAPDFSSFEPERIVRMCAADVTRADPRSAEARAMVAALSADLAATYADKNDDGSGAFKPEDVLGERAAFVVAWLDGAPVGCGAIRPFDGVDDVVEVKRMFVMRHARGLGISRLILHKLEELAREFGFAKTLLETGDRQVEAIPLYISAGYARVPCYGQYANREWSLCFEKALKG